LLRGDGIRQVTYTSEESAVAKSIILEVPTADREYFEKLSRDGHDVTVVDVERFEGVVSVIEVLATLTGALAPILVAYLEIRKGGTSESDEPASTKAEPKVAKKLIVDGQRVTFENFTPEEIKSLLTPD
jgi:hypothetical protein